jgi:hypothetical protein
MVEVTDVSEGVVSPFSRNESKPSKLLEVGSFLLFSLPGLFYVTENGSDIFL